MSKKKQNKDYRNMSFEDAVHWTNKHCQMEDVRMRIASRQVAYIFFNEIIKAGRYIQDLEERLAVYEGGRNGS